MPAVLAQVHGDTVGAGFLGVQGGLHRVRIAGAPGLAQGGDVIDVHAEQNSSGFSHGVTLTVHEQLAADQRPAAQMGSERLAHQALGRRQGAGGAPVGVGHG